MDNNDSFIGALAVFGIFILPVLGWIAFRVMKHRERMEMIRHGMTPRPGAAEAWTSDWAQQQKAGPAPAHVPSPPDVYAAQRQLRKGITVALIGLAITTGLSFTGTGPQLLGGLIPLFVGVAQIIGALLSGASFTPTHVPYGAMPPPSAPPPGAQVPPAGAYSGPYAYRPDPNIQELQPPASPPDRR
ncbi:MAG: DUF6249 domain-containing protein [Candidatus Baltobacteraceae bacterium]